MDNATSKFVRAGTLEELKAKGGLVVHGHHRPVLLVCEDGQVFALDNRCPHMVSLWSVAASRTAS
jgi:nitrite reductase/ring-hydroxylating ferredoxin subunit